MDGPNRPRYFRCHEAAEVLRVAPATLRSWRAVGRGPETVKIGGRVLWPSAAVYEFLGDPDGDWHPPKPPAPPGPSAADLKRAEALLMEALELLRSGSDNQGHHDRHR